MSKDLISLLGDHENVYVQVVSNGKLLREDFYSRQYSYFFYDSEYEETENLRTITVVSNPGAENERIDTVRTQPVPEEPNTDADVTV